MTGSEFESWARLNAPRLLRCALSLTGDDSSADDLLQDVLLAAYQRWDRIRDVDHPSGYVVTMLVNRHLSLRRSWAREARRMRLAAGPATTDGIAALDDPDAVLREVAQLPRAQRVVITLRALGDWPDERIAEVLGCSPSTVRAHAARGLARLRARRSARADQEPR